MNAAIQSRIPRYQIKSAIKSGKETLSQTRFSQFVMREGLGKIVPSFRLDFDVSGVHY